MANNVVIKVTPVEAYDTTETTINTGASQFE